MKRVLYSLFVVVLACVIWFYLPDKQKEDHASAIPAQETVTRTQWSGQKATGANTSIPASQVESYPLWEGGKSNDLEDARWRIVEERDQKDPRWRGKLAMEFYGKVVDQDGSSLAGAQVDAVKIDLSNQGSTTLKAESDSIGLFSITGAQGRSLSIEVKKAGFYSSKTQPRYFEYAEFSDDRFYQPKRNEPVVFTLIKLGQLPQLLYNELEIKVGLDTPIEHLIGGGVKLSMQLLENSSPNDKRWSLKIALADGGIQPALEEFPYLAPTEGYKQTIILDTTTPKPPTWVGLYHGGSFYIQAGNNYGRIEIQMIGGKDWLRVRSWINPSGSRNLEFSPSK